MKNVIIATIKSWNIKNALEFKEKYKNKYNVEIITNKDSFSLEKIEEIKPDYIFLPHWSWIIPKAIYTKYKCIVFHASDLPYGRGGSPIQNLIVRGIKKSKICAIDVTEKIDAGDIYCKEDIDLSFGNADEILTSISKIVYDKLIPYILENNPKPEKQKGEVLEFKRRKPEESNITTSKINNLEKIYDFIRMLDGEGYPKAFIELDNLKIEFSNVINKDDILEGNFVIYEK